MKKIISTLLITSPLLCANPDYRNWIVQIQGDEANTTHFINNIAPSGNSPSSEGVIGSSVFQLWTIHRTTAREYLLDEKTVSSYHPEASIRIISTDPYQLIPRTRVDQPFRVEYTVGGIVTDDPNAPQAAKSVVFNHRVTRYADGQNTSGNAQSSTLSHIALDSNGTTRWTTFTSITAPDLTTARGHEEFSIYANPDFGVSGASLLAKKMVQIWPVARATMSGINTSQEYTKVPSVTVNLLDLYPDSTTYMHIYEGPPTTTPASPKKINTSYVIKNTTKPENHGYTLTGLNEQITKDGLYTLEILHETPFGIDILASTYPLNVKRAIKINGNVNSSE